MESRPTQPPPLPPSSRSRISVTTSAAGVLWGYDISELMKICAIGVRRVLGSFAPLMMIDDDDGAVEEVEWW